ncbi:MAG: multidrug MFS transporter, partial [Pseudomonadota bacterium]
LLGRLGMVRMIRFGLTAHLGLSLALMVIWATGAVAGLALFGAFVVWQVGSFALAALTIGNLNAIAMQPLGHVAGMASSVISASATILAVLIAIPIGQAFNGTPVPLALGVALCTGLGLWLAAKLQEDGPDP